MGNRARRQASRRASGWVSGLRAEAQLAPGPRRHPSSPSHRPSPAHALRAQFSGEPHPGPAAHPVGLPGSLTAFPPRRAPGAVSFPQQSLTPS